MAMKGLVSVSKLLADAEEHRYAVGAFNFTDLVDVQAAIEAAEEEHSPVIIQIHPAGIDVLGLHYVMAIARATARQASVPVALHLDHGRDMEAVKTCVQAGFSSVMIDGSRLPIAENIEITREAVEIGHASGVNVEAELGRVGLGSDKLSDDDRQKFLTDPEEAREFVEKTSVDSLAVAVGSAHGLYHFEPDLDFRRLKGIRKRVKTHLVLHGGSDLPEDQILKAIELGITKINVHTDLIGAYTRTLRGVVDASEGLIWPSHVLSETREAIKEVVKARIRLFGSSGTAD